MANEPQKWANLLGSGADINTIPEETPAGTGAASMKSIFPRITQVPLNAGGIAPDRADFNGLFKLLGDNIYYQQQGGVYSYSDTIDYAKGSLVKHNDKAYIAVQANGPATIEMEPGEDPAYWKPIAITVNGENADGNGNITISELDGYAKESTEFSIPDPLLTITTKYETNTYTEALQGYCTDGTYLYAAIVSSNSSNQKIKKINISTGVEVKEVLHTDLFHVNDCCIHKGNMYVTYNTKILVLSTDTLLTTSTINVPSEMGGVNGITSDGTNLFIQRMSDNTIFKTDDNLNVINSFTCDMPNGWSFQGLSYHDGYLYVLTADALPRRTALYYNLYLRIGYDGKIQRVFTIPLKRELECIDFIDGKALLGVNSQYGGTTKDGIYSFFTWNIFGDVTPSKNGYPNYPIYDRELSFDYIMYVTKNDSTFKTGTGTDEDPFNRIEDAIETVRLLQNIGFNFTIRLNGDFSDRTLTIKHIDSNIIIRKSDKSGASATLGSLDIHSCNGIIELRDLTINPTDATKDGIALLGSRMAMNNISIINDTGSTNRIGIYAFMSEVISDNNISISNFNEGIKLNHSTLLGSGVTYNNCTNSVNTYFGHILTSYTNLFNDTFIKRNQACFVTTQQITVGGFVTVDTTDTSELNTVYSTFVKLPQNCTVYSVNATPKTGDPRKITVSIGDIVNYGDTGTRGFNVNWVRTHDISVVITWTALIGF